MHVSVIPREIDKLLLHRTLCCHPARDECLHQWHKLGQYGDLFSDNSKDLYADHVDNDGNDDDSDDGDGDDNDDNDGDNDDEWEGLGAVKPDSCLFPPCLRFYPQRTLTQCFSGFAFVLTILIFVAFSDIMIYSNIWFTWSCIVIFM